MAASLPREGAATTPRAAAACDIDQVLQHGEQRHRDTAHMLGSIEQHLGHPVPDLFLHAASQMDVAPARCVVVEDSRFGVEAARAAGMRSLGYAGGLTPAEWLEGPGTIVVDDMDQPPGLVADWPAAWVSCRAETRVSHD